MSSVHRLSRTGLCILWVWAFARFGWSDIDCESDTTPPVIVCPADQTLDVDRNCTALVPNFRTCLNVTDNCSTRSFSYQPPDPADFNAVRYVAPDGGNEAPYTSPTQAARVIQDAIDASSAGDLVLVAAGTYETGGRTAPGRSLMNRVYIPAGVTVASLVGTCDTTIRGRGPLGSLAMRGAWLERGGRLMGFTITEGHTNPHGAFIYDTAGGGVFLRSGGELSQCVIKNNRAWESGGVHVQFGPALVKNCRIENNIGEDGVGGLQLRDARDSVVEYCWITGNSTPRNFGGLHIVHAGRVSNCLIAKNAAGEAGGGGGVDRGTYYGHQEVIFENCTIADNVGRRGV
ncbi:MAG: right-handed parallel beta-helix repeat-containing protein, partial [Verrucomicrobiota bacterium]